MSEFVAGFLENHGCISLIRSLFRGHAHRLSVGVFSPLACGRLLLAGRQRLKASNPASAAPRSWFGTAAGLACAGLESAGLDRSLK